MNRITREKLPATRARVAAFRRLPTRAAFVRAAILAALSSVLLGCASVQPDYLFAEAEHVSHPFAGYPFGPASDEDCLNQQNVGAGWSRGGAYVEQSLGVKLNDCGFYGPDLTYTLRIGYRIPLNKGGSK